MIINILICIKFNSKIIIINNARIRCVCVCVDVDLRRRGSWTRSLCRKIVPTT